MDDLRDIAAGLRTIDDPRTLLEGLIANAPVAYHIYRADGCSLAVNAAFRALFQAVPPPGYNVLEDPVAAETGMLAMIRRAFAGETVHVPTIWFDPNDIRQVEVRKAHRIAVSATFSPVHGPTGALAYVVMCFRDETTSVLAREAAEAEASKLRVAQRMAHLGSWDLELAGVADRDQGPLRWSDEVFRIFGHEPGAIEVTNEAFFAAVHPDDRERIREAVGRALEDGTPYRLDHRVLRPDGSERLVHEQAEVVRDAGGRPVRMVGTVHDVTDQRRADELRRRSLELEQQNRRILEANRLKSEFLANMSHELRTPLNAIIGFAELLQDGDIAPGSPQYAEFAGDIVASGRHLLQLINDVLDLSKVEAGKMEFRPTPIAVPMIIGEVCTILRAVASAKQIAVETDLDPSIEIAIIDPARLKQVLYNYLSNALKFTPAGGRVVIRLRPRAPEAFRIDVEDNGIGIAPEDLDGLFVEFHQLDNSLTKRHPGTGLGLALTRRLVEAQGGWVGVESRLGEGSTFHAVLPLDATRIGALAGARPPPRAPTSAATSVERVRFLPELPGGVLIVDDDVPAARLMAAMLAQLGYAAICRADAESGLIAAAELAPIAVVLDLLMPGIDGFDFLDRLRRLDGHARTPVLVWTIKDLTSAERERLERTAHGVVAKGSAAEELVHALRTMLPPRGSATP